MAHREKTNSVRTDLKIKLIVVKSSMYMKSRYYLISFFELCFDRLMIFVQIEHINHVTGGQLSTRIYHLKAIEIVCPFFFGFVDVIEFQTPANMLFADFN